MLYYHHSRSLESVIFGEVKASPRHFDYYLKDSYLWLKKEIGFYPIFLSVGLTDEGLFMTGYQNQWRKIIGTKNIGRKKDGKYIQKNILRKKGEFPNEVLFSFEEVEGIFMDYMGWHLALGSYRDKITDYERSIIFKSSWGKSKWLKKAKKDPDSVQLVTLKLALPDAKRIYVRNNNTKSLLEKIGFNNILVKRMPVNL